ncbi:MAG: class I SAM-dependent methyltransferase [Alphaproteobacteria bacterium]
MEPKAYREMADLEERHWWFVGRRRIIDALLRRLPLPRQARLLEIGCGSGGNLSMLARYGTVSAGEYDDETRARAASRQIADRVSSCELPNEFPFPNESFDLIAMFDVLEHIADDAETLSVIRDRLNKDGWLLLTVPMFPFLWSAHDVYNHHQRRYTRSDLASKLRNAGFDPIFQSYYNFWLFPLVAAVRLVKNLLGEDTAGDLSMPPNALNRVLAMLFSSERHAMGRVALPFGVSYILAARPIQAASDV